MQKRSVAVFAAMTLMMCGSAARCGAQTAEAREAGAPGSAAATSVPRLVQFNGTLKDTAARPVSGVASVTFAIYAEQDGGSALWTETQNVLADSNGHFNALLGTATAGGFPSELFSAGQSRWLGVTIARSPEMPRLMLASVPYAMKAGDADTLGGLPASSYVTAQQLAARTAIVAPSTTIVSSPFATAPAGALSTPSADAAQVLGGGSVTQAAVTGTGTANYLPLWTSGTNLGVSKIYQANGGFVGINTSTPLLQLDVNGNSIFRGSFQMAPQGTATASTGQPSHSFQWQSSVYNSSTKAADNLAFGFRTVPDQNDVASPTAKLDLFYGPGGGTLNDLGLSINHSGVITFVPSQTFSGSIANVNTVNLPNSTGSTTGTVVIGGNQFLADWGDPTNTFVGANSGIARATTGTDNTALGTYSLDFDTSGGDNTALGAFAMFQNTQGSSNVAVGDYAMYINTTGTNNVAVGGAALGSLKTGNNNVAIGSGTGNSTVSGNNNTYVGSGATGADGISNSSAFGTGATVTASNSLVLGQAPGSGTATAVGIGTTAPEYTFEVIDSGRGGAAIFGASNIAGDSAVVGNNTATTASGSNGGSFYSQSPNGSGILAVNQSGGYGGYFIGNTYAAYFQGNVGISGTLTKGGGSFKIDDPIDPANKYLSHSFVESPDMMNIYNGNITTDAKGFATVSMPDWFEALNRDFRYQLTTINSFSRATVAAELKDGKFRIRTSQPHVKVSWQVTGIRHDAWANANRIPNEESKPGDEHGKYLHPELFGAGPDKQIGMQPRPAAAPVNANAASPSAETTGRR